MTSSRWNILRYESTCWAHAAHLEKKLYIGHFWRGKYMIDWEEESVQFWAEHPRLAMQTIAKSGRDPHTFDHTVIN